MSALDSGADIQLSNQERAWNNSKYYLDMRDNKYPLFVLAKEGGNKKGVYFLEK